eukprot:5874369-Pyramimonas_sp.AAC.1
MLFKYVCSKSSSWLLAYYSQINPTKGRVMRIRGALAAPMTVRGAVAVSKKTLACATRASLGKTAH